MAVNVGTTTVINDDEELVAITGADGSYDNFTPNATAITTNLDMSIPMMYTVMSQNRTFSLSNTSAAAASLFLLDTSADNYTPTFDSNIVFVGGTPDWTTFRHWQISLQCDVGSPGTVRASALGYTTIVPPAPVETVSLEGTSSNPETNNIYRQTDGTITTGWRFYSDGRVADYSSEVNPTDDFLNHERWNNVTPTGTWYMRITESSWTNLPVGTQGGPNMPGASISAGLWEPLTSSRVFGLVDYRAPGSVGSVTFTWKVEISRNNDGSNIAATGYYMAWHEGGN